MLSKEAESHSKCLEGKGRHVHPNPLRHRRALSCWRKGCRPGNCSYRWVGTVLKASSLDRFTPTFCKFKDEKKLNFKAKVSRAAAVFAQHAAVTWHKKWVNFNAYFLKMLCKTQGKVPAPEQDQAWTSSWCQELYRAPELLDLCCQWKASLRPVSHQVWWDSQSLYTICRSQCYSF